MSPYNDHDKQRFSGDDSVDYRQPFGRDRDRILYSSAFRRLAGKTQVVAAGELGDFHTRMTHSLKVAQLGRRLAQFLQVPGEKSSELLPDPELLEAACLAHDLGHPPFGHAGEEALQRAADELIVSRERKRNFLWKSDETIKREFGGFEGNAQTLRILVRLAARHRVTSKGLDLTRAVLDGTIKYPWLRQSSGKGARKWNVYPDDEEYALWIRDGRGLGPTEEKSIEARLMDWCDDVAYACHDLQDFYRAGIIPLHQIFEFSVEMNEDMIPSATVIPANAELVRELVANLREKDKDYDFDDVVEAMIRLSNLISVDTSYDGSRAAKSAMHQTTSALITRFFGAVSVKSGVLARYQGKIEIDPEAVVEVEVLKELIWTYVIRQPALRSQQVGQQRILKDLLQIFYESEFDPQSLLPHDRQEDANKGVHYLRCCIDHVASMTEPAAIALHHRLTGIELGLHSDGSWRI
jgi:dGTPase